MSQDPRKTGENYAASLPKPIGVSDANAVADTTMNQINTFESVVEAFSYVRGINQSLSHDAKDRHEVVFTAYGETRREHPNAAVGYIGATIEDGAETNIGDSDTVAIAVIEVSDE